MEHAKAENRKAGDIQEVDELVDDIQVVVDQEKSYLDAADADQTQENQTADNQEVDQNIQEAADVQVAAMHQEESFREEMFLLRVEGPSRAGKFQEEQS